MCLIFVERLPQKIIFLEDGFFKYLNVTKYCLRKIFSDLYRIFNGYKLQLLIEKQLFTIPSILF